MRFCVFGVIVADLIAEPVDLHNLSQSVALARLNSVSFHPGGNACNVAAALAKLGHNFGVKAATAGLIGDDLIGELLVSTLQSTGVDTAAITAIRGGKTGATVVAVRPGGEPYFLHAPGVLDQVDPDCFRARFGQFAACDWLHIGYFGLLPISLFEAMPAMLGELRQLAPRLRISLDTAHAPTRRDLLDAILPHLDLFGPSRAEAISLSGQTDPAAAVASFRRQMPRGIIGIKLDRDGCYLDDGASAVHCPAYPVDVVDTTGAGDAWFAGLLMARSQDLSLAAAGRFANRVAADCCTQLGGTTAIADFESTIARA
jgi:sugar/nucleoside kinase (ribokinase family)